MEVHHPHHSEHPGHKIKWSHYFWEFFMLFLAVTLGFLVENQRERFIERRREKQFIRHLLSDLREDSVFIAKRIKGIEEDGPVFMNFVGVMTGTVSPSTKEVLTAGLKLLWQYDMHATMTTYSEMKTTGSLRFIKDYDLTSSLEKYYEILIPRAITNAEEANKFYHDYVTAFVLKHFRIQDVDLEHDAVINPNPVAYGRSPETDQELLNIMGNYRHYHEIQLDHMLKPAILKAAELILLIRKEYDLR